MGRFTCADHRRVATTTWECLTDDDGQLRGSWLADVNVANGSIRDYRFRCSRLPEAVGQVERHRNGLSIPLRWVRRGPSCSWAAFRRPTRHGQPAPEASTPSEEVASLANVILQPAHHGVYDTPIDAMPQPGEAVERGGSSESLELRDCIDGAANGHHDIGIAMHQVRAHRCVGNPRRAREATRQRDHAPAVGLLSWVASSAMIAPCEKPISVVAAGNTAQACRHHCTACTNRGMAAATRTGPSASVTPWTENHCQPHPPPHRALAR